MKKVILILVVVVLLAFIGFRGFYYTTVDNVTITVTNTERVVKGSGENMESKYMVFTDTETFENTDDFWFWKWDSSDVQGELKKDSTFTVKVVGWRVPFLSMYRNVISVE